MIFPKGPPSPTHRLAPLLITPPSSTSNPPLCQLEFSSPSQLPWLYIVIITIKAIYCNWKIFTVHSNELLKWYGVDRGRDREPRMQPAGMHTHANSRIRLNWHCRIDRTFSLRSSALANGFGNKLLDSALFSYNWTREMASLFSRINVLSTVVSWIFS